MARKDVLIRGVDDSVYRRAKAVAASMGITLVNSVDEALAEWARDEEDTALQARVDSDLAFVHSNWNKKIRPHKGKVVVISDSRLRGAFPSFEEARVVASKHKVAMVFLVDKEPGEHEIEFGPELEI